MGFKKVDWVKYGKVGRIWHIKLKDESGESLEEMKWLSEDKDSERKIFTILKNQWGLFKYQNPTRT